MARARARLNSERLVAIAAILVAVAPLSSMYHIFFQDLESGLINTHSNTATMNYIQASEMGFKVIHPFRDNSESIGDESKTFDKEKLEEYWKGFYEWGAIPDTKMRIYGGVGGTTIPVTTLFRIHDWALILPWCFSVVLGIFVPLYKAIKSDLRWLRRRWGMNRTRIPTDIEKFLNSKRREKVASLIIACQDYSKVRYHPCLGVSLSNYHCLYLF